MTNISMTIRVLLVEDEMLSRWAVRNVLESFGCQVSEADTCQQAGEMLAVNAYHLVIMDHRLPDGFGTEVLTHSRLAGRHVICMTAEPESISTAERDAAGIEAVIAKPVETARLRELLGPVFDAIAAEADSGSATALQGVTTGPFFVANPGATLERSFLRQCVVGEYGKFIALDLSAVSTVSGEAMEALLTLARECTRAGGRLAVVGLAGSIRSEWTRNGLDREFALLGELRELESEGRRLMGSSERRGLLDTVIRRGAV